MNTLSRYCTGLALAGVMMVATMSGCVGYRLGSTLPPGIEVVLIEPFTSEVAEPLLDVETQQATINEFQREGTLTVGNADNADVVLTVTLTDFSLAPLRFNRDATTTTEEYRMEITADITLTTIATGEVMTQSTVTGYEDFIPSGDLSSAKRSAMPEAARDLAVQIVKGCVEFW